MLQYLRNQVEKIHIWINFHSCIIYNTTRHCVVKRFLSCKKMPLLILRSVVVLHLLCGAAMTNKPHD